MEDNKNITKTVTEEKTNKNNVKQITWKEMTTIEKAVMILCCVTLFAAIVILVIEAVDERPFSLGLLGGLAYLMLGISFSLQAFLNRKKGIALPLIDLVCGLLNIATAIIHFMNI